ncbi:MAG TPA: DUF1345 domain-containing protein [Polyangia bacterium]|nr:DUF1345 domain-containing protein [Polyangia bacterium]
MTGKRPRAFARHDPRQARVRVAIAAAVGAFTALAIPARFGPALRTVAAWDVAAVTSLLLALSIVLHASPEETGRRAAADDPGRHASNALVIASSAISLLSTAIVLRQARHYAPQQRALFVALCVLAVASSWALTQTMYTLRYAHLYYHDDHEGIGGLEFPGGGHPSYLDFAYLSFTIGMCFQVSDVAVSSRPIRRTVLGHALLSFVYNTAIVATAINLAVGVFS